MSKPILLLRKTKCATCPFRLGSPYTYLRPALEASACTEASRVCHSTGSNNGINHRTGFPPHLCRGARDLQLELFAALGVIEEPTDMAWDAARLRIGLPVLVIRDPAEHLEVDDEEVKYMIRYVDLASFYWCDEPESGEPRYPFAFLDTITDRFIELDGTQIWDCVEDFKVDHASEFPEAVERRELERFLNKLPDTVPQKRGVTSRGDP